MFKDDFRETFSRNRSDHDNAENDSNHQQPFITIQSSSRLNTTTTSNNSLHTPHHAHHYNNNRTNHHYYQHNTNNNNRQHNRNDSNSQSFEMIPLTVLTPYKNNNQSSSTNSLSSPLSNQSLLLSLPSSPSPTTNSIASSLKRSNSSGGLETKTQISARSSDFSFLDETQNNSNNMNNSQHVGYADSYMLMWSPWYSMYSNLFVEFWMVRIDSNVSSSEDEESCINSGGENVNCKLLPIKQASKSSNNVERFPTGNFWSYSVGLETFRENQQSNQCVSTHYFGNELEDLIICFFGVTKIMKFKLNVTKMKVRDRKSSTTREYVTGVESVEFVELIDYDYLSRKSPLDAYSSWDSFPDSDIDESENEVTQDIYQSLFRATSNGSSALKISNIPRLEFVHNDNELNFVKCDNDYNFNIYSMNKRRMEDNGNYSPLSLELTPQTPTSSGSTTLAIIQKTSVDLSKLHSLNVLFFQKQTTRKLFNKAKSPTSGRFELRASNSVKTGFETIGDVIPFDLDTLTSVSGIPRLDQPSQYVKMCKIDDNMFVVMEIDKYLLRKLGNNENAENIDSMLNTHHHVTSLPKYFKLFLLDLSNPEDIKIKKLTNVKKQQHTSPKVNTNLPKFTNSSSPNTSSLGIEESKGFIPIYKHQKSKRMSKPHFTFQHDDDIFNMIVFRQDPHGNPHHYTLAIFYKALGDRYQFNGEISDHSPFKGKWYELVHFTHVSWSKYKTLFDQANFLNHADPSLIANLGFTDIYFEFE